MIVLQFDAETWDYKIGWIEMTIFTPSLARLKAEFFRMNEAMVTWQGAVHSRWICYRGMRPRGQGEGHMEGVLQYLVVFGFLPLAAETQKIKFRGGAI